MPAEFAQALRELGLAGAGAVTGTPLTGGVSSDIWRIDSRAGPGMRQARAGQAARRGRLARADRAQPVRSALDARGQRGARRDARRACSGQHPALGVLVMNYLPPSEYRLWKQQLRDGHADAATAREVGRVLGRIHSHSARRPELAAEFDTDADLLRHPPRALPARHRAAAPGSRVPARASRRRHALASRGPGARRRQSEEHPDRRRRDRCSSTPSARGGAIRPSTSPSA